MFIPATPIQSPADLLPTSVGHAALVRTGDQSKEIRVSVPVPEKDTYYLLVDYHSWEPNAMPIRARVQQGDTSIAEGILLVNLDKIERIVCHGLIRIC